MEHERTTAAVGRFLADLAGESPTEPVVRALLERAAGRLHVLSASLLYRSYPRLTQPPLNLESEDLLSAVVERLLKAMREVKPTNVRQFFALANKHMRWELNDLARRLDERTQAIELRPEFVASPETSGSMLSPVARRIFEAIETLPTEEQEVFDLVRINGMTHPEAADVLGVSTKTVQRRLNRSLLLLADKLADLKPV